MRPATVLAGLLVLLAAKVLAALCRRLMTPVLKTQHSQSHAAPRGSAAAPWVTAALFALMIGCDSSLGVEPADLTGDWNFRRTDNLYVGILQDSSGALTGSGSWVTCVQSPAGDRCEVTITYPLNGRYQHPSVSFVLGADTTYRFEGRLVQCKTITGLLNGQADELDRVFFDGC
jgi:hypothetical protein